MNEKVQKTSQFNYDENGGLIFMQKWHPVIRWISILPAMLIAFIIIRIFFLGGILSLFQDDIPEVYFSYITAIASGIVYYFMVDIAAAVAPSNRVLTSIVVAVILGLLLTTLAIFLFNEVLNNDLTVDKTYLTIGLCISLFSTILGLYLGVKVTIFRQKK